MIYPSIDKLLNVVDSKYALVHVASRRARQMYENSFYQMKEKDYKSKSIGGSCRRLNTYKIVLSFFVKEVL